MMILVLLGSSRLQQQKIVDTLAKELSGYSVRHVDNGSDICDANKKHRNLNTALLGRNYGDTVTVVTGVDSVTEYNYLARYRSVFCLLPGILPRIFGSGEIPITNDFLYISLAPEKMSTLEKRRVYMSPLEAFSECYQRQRGGRERG
ncbi:hypothetical protein [Enterobacter ludwigii]|uniref:hypothetical protein n=1 Tax=Enterobacter ludwigii TaxID=299767 RepID=UPI0030760E04